MTIHLPSPELQISFAAALERIRGEYLLDALLSTVSNLDLARLDQELSRLVPANSLKHLAGNGLRGEVLFAVPYLLEANPRLLGYYRLLLGYSQKAFYTSSTGLTSFATMEANGSLNDKQQAALPSLSAALIEQAAVLLVGLGSTVTVGRLDDLTLLTLGPQLRGGNNVAKGMQAITDLFRLIQETVQHATVSVGPQRITLINASGREVLIEFSNDPDIVIREQLDPGTYRNLVAIEVKGGSDFSNIHNRVGEAEKSHQKARLNGFSECWTVVNVDNIDVAMAHQESPSTNHFYRLAAVLSKAGAEWEDFRRRLVSSIGIPLMP